MSENEKTIDFVITWVDGSDPEWIEKRNTYKEDNSADTRSERYRDFGTLKYLLRGIDAYAPWVRKVYLITEGHLPEWINKDCDKLSIVRHADFMPEELLPTFNSNAIEMYLHKIPGLSEKFVYFNDDMIILKKLKEEDFFLRDKPRDMLALQPVVANPYNPVMSNILLNDSIVISRHFDKRKNIKANISKYFHIGYPLMYFVYNFLELAFPLHTGFYTVHGASPFLKSTFEELWEKEHDTLYATAQNRFRSKDDVTQYLFREWEKQKGNFVPANLHRDFRYFNTQNDNKSLLSVIRKRSKKMICINDSSIEYDYEKTRTEVLDALEKSLSRKSPFEVMNE
ncbi:MAG: Stealth CR1 domain-containing protein [Lachnospiraceae bacterium]|nr:Stealth CR1 domain-containing protein [Lachnospiraceae bacterium]